MTPRFTARAWIAVSSTASVGRSSRRERNARQIETLLFGPMNVTRAVLPLMREQSSGLLLTFSSTAGIAGQAFCTAYAAAKLGVKTLLARADAHRELSPSSLDDA